MLAEDLVINNSSHYFPRMVVNNHRFKKTGYHVKRFSQERELRKENRN